jgi:hypothetical protein
LVIGVARAPFEFVVVAFNGDAQGGPHAFRQIGGKTSQLEFQLNALVYKLYQVSYAEVKLIDPAFTMSEKEYQQFQSNV